MKQITNNSELLLQFLAAEDRIADGQNQVKVCAGYSRAGFIRVANARKNHANYPCKAC